MKKPRVNLGAIRGFAAAARHLSFTAAAEELNLTQGAISRQIAALEEDLGVPLFRRMTRRIALTDAGAKFQEAVVAALLVLERGVESISGSPSAQTITVSVLPTIGSVWLMPRLHKFTNSHPGIEVRMVTSIEPADFSGGVDVAVRAGPLPGRSYDAGAPRIDLRMATNWSEVEARELFPDILVPVMSRKLRRAGGDRSLAETLEAFPLIHTSTRRHGWPDWLRAQGLAIKRREPLLEFGHFFMALEEARAGRGIALVPSVVLPGLDYRRSLHFLQAVRSVPSAGEYYALSAKHRAASPAVKSFVAWLASEASQHRARLKNFT